MRVIIILILIASAFQAFALGSESTTKPATKKRVIDLGELEVTGEVRRPPVLWIDSDQKVRNEIPKLYRKQFLALEEELLSARTQAQPGEKR
jgi:hypothetical protein